MHSIPELGFARTDVSLVVKQHIGWFTIAEQPGLVAFVEYGLTSERTSPRDTAATRTLGVHTSWSPDDPDYTDTQAHLRRSAGIWIPNFQRPDPIAGQGVGIKLEQDRTGVHVSPYLRTSVEQDPRYRRPSVPRFAGSEGEHLHEEAVEEHLKRRRFEMLYPGGSEALYAYHLKNLFFDSVYPNGLEAVLMPEVREIVEAAQQEREKQRWGSYR